MKSAWLGLMLLGVLVAWCGKLHLRDGGWAFADDAAYLDQRIAANVASGNGYAAIAGHPAPAIRDTLWRFLLAPLAGSTNGLFFSVLLGIVFAALSVVAASRLAKHLNPSSGAASAVLAATFSGLAVAAWSGLSDALAALLVTSAVASHLGSFESQQEPLSFRAAVLVGLAVLLRAEFGLVWLIFWLHAMIVAALRKGDREMQLVVLRGLNGALVIALALAPLLSINLKATGVPWPAWPGPTPERTGFAAAFALAHQATALRSVIPLLLLWAALALLAWRGFREKEPAAGLFPVLLYMLVPIFFAAAAFGLGWAAAPSFFRAFAPVWLAILAAGLCSAPGVGRFGFGIAVLLLAFSIPSSLAQIESATADVQAAVDRREMLEDVLANPLNSFKTVATDDPGWMGTRGGFNVFDLTGETIKETLAPVQRGDFDGVVDAAREAKCDALILWREKDASWADRFPHKIITRPGKLPLVARLNWTATP